MSELPTRALCVGGPNHGEYLPTFDTWWVRVPKERDLYAEFTVSDRVAVPIFVTGTYELRQMAVPRGEDGAPVWVLAWRGWDK